jgi:hypothetical protein
LLRGASLNREIPDLKSVYSLGFLTVKMMACDVTQFYGVNAILEEL